MKNLLTLSIGLALLTGCDSGSSAPSTQTVSPEVLAAPAVIPVQEPTVTPTIDPVASPTPDVTATPSPSPTVTASPSPSPTVTPYAFSGGSGTSGDPYRVSTASDLTHIADFQSASYQVMQSIDLNGAAFTPIAHFTGALDGQGYTISNLSITTSGANHAAIFTKMSGLVSNLVFTGAQVTSNGTGCAAVVAGVLDGEIDNITIGTFAGHGSVSGAQVFGQNTGGSIHCELNTTVNGAVNNSSAVFYFNTIKHATHWTTGNPTGTDFTNQL